MRWSTIRAAHHLQDNNIILMVVNWAAAKLKVKPFTFSLVSISSLLVILAAVDHALSCRKVLVIQYRYGPQSCSRDEQIGATKLIYYSSATTISESLKKPRPSRFRNNSQYLLLLYILKCSWPQRYCNTRWPEKPHSPGGDNLPAWAWNYFLHVDYSANHALFLLSPLDAGHLVCHGCG